MGFLEVGKPLDLTYVSLAFLEALGDLAMALPVGAQIEHPSLPWGQGAFGRTSGPRDLGPTDHALDELRGLLDACGDLGDILALGLHFEYPPFDRT